jgi:predicted Rossmann fold flavoprotein
MGDGSVVVDAIVIGAGAAGLFCAGVANQRGASVVLIDHAPKLAEKIRISGGGRCNFTNIDGADHARFESQSPRFAKAALKNYLPQQFVDLLKKHRVGYHEKHKGQLFCDDSAEDIIRMLVAECEVGGSGSAGPVKFMRPCGVQEVGQEASSEGQLFRVATDQGVFRARNLVVATGGLSIAPIGATDFGYRLAKQFGLAVVPTRPALVPLTFEADTWRPFVDLSGASLPVQLKALDEGGKQLPNSPTFDEDLLFTHRGLSGPGVLQISTYWQPNKPLEINLLREKFSLVDAAWQAKKDSNEHNKMSISSLLSEYLPKRLVQTWLTGQAIDFKRNLAELSRSQVRELALSLAHWRLYPTGTEGFKKAEVTSGGVSTNDLESRSLEAKSVPGLHFIGEVVDVTGWLGGYNFQWAWASAFACAEKITRKA